MTDGKSGLKNPTVRCFNLLDGSSQPRRYHYIDDNISQAAVSIDHDLEGDGDPLGSDTQAGREAGVLNIQCEQIDQPAPFPASVIELNKVGVAKYYVVTAEGAQFKRNDMKRYALPVKRLYNPFCSGLLGPLGNYFEVSKAATSTLSAAAVNTRAGATVAYALAMVDGTALPAGLAINSSSGMITLTAVAQATYELEVTITDTLTGKRERKGTGTISLTVTA